MNLHYGRPPSGPVETKDQAVYVMSVPSGHFKIGRAADVQKRRDGLQCGCPEVISIVGASQLGPNGVDANEMEREVHRILKNYRSVGEWFKVPRIAINIAWKEAWTKLAKPDLYARLERMRNKRSANVSFDCPECKRRREQTLARVRKARAKRDTT